MIDRRKVLFVEPPFYRLFKDTYSDERLPLGAASLAGVARRDTSWEPRILNADFAGLSEYRSIRHLSGAGFRRYISQLNNGSPVFKDISLRIRAERPAVVGISVRSANAASAGRVARIVKEEMPEAFVVGGGAHATADPAGVLEESAFDAVVCGEGESVIVELLRVLEGGGSWENVPGVCRRQGREVVRNPPPGPVADLDSLPFAHASAAYLIDREAYPLSAFRYVSASRGCPGVCSFCGSAGLWGRNVRVRSPENVAEELHLLSRRGLRRVHFVDDTFGRDGGHLESLCRAFLRRGTGVTWSCTTRADLLGPDAVRLMREAGCRSVEVGVESGNNELLRLVRKGQTIEDAERALWTLRRAGIEAVGLFMAGFPDETEAMLSSTLQAMKRLPCDRIHFGMFTPYPGSEAFGSCLERGRIPSDYEPSHYFHQSPRNAVFSPIAPERLRALVGEMQALADRRNRRGRLSSVLRSEGRGSLAERGALKGVRKAVRFFLGW